MKGDRSPPLIELRGVRVHNLRNIDLDLPLRKLIVITGVSGSGKSSLAFDTLAAEGQRRYIESFSTYARQFLDRLEKPDADRIDHIPPAIAIRQKSGGRSRRSTVATGTEIHDYLRLLYAKAGVIVCPECRREVRRDSPATVQERLMALVSGTRFQVCFPCEIGGGETPSGGAGDVLRGLKESGFSRLIIGGRTVTIDEKGSGVFAGIKDSRPLFLVVVDRLTAGTASPERLADSVELAFQFGEGRCVVLSRDAEGTPGERLRVDDQEWRVERFDERLICGGCRREFAAPEPRLFSFNSPLGACPVCHGLGVVRETSTGRRGASTVCPACDGARLQPLALAVRVHGLNLAELCRLTIDDMREFCERLVAEARLFEKAGRLVVPQIVARLRYLEQVGLDYLSLDRPLATLSAGEAQRVMLTAALGSNLVNTLYVLDEPTVGLHPRDTERLFVAIERLRNAGNTVVVVEHDAVVMRRADQLIDIGPGAGHEGGRVVFQGSPREIANCPASVTGDFLAGRRQIAVTDRERRCEPQPVRLRLEGVRHNNLHDVTVSLPLGVLCVVTGVSGSGKSSLVQETLYPALHHALGERSPAFPKSRASETEPGRPHPNPPPEGEGGDAIGHFERLTGWEQLDDVVFVDQRPVGRTPRANPATYLHVFAEIRSLFAGTAEAKVRNFTAGHFSFNTAAGGRCPACNGDGSLAIDMQFLPDVTMICPDCHGTRYRREILDVKYRGRTIAEVLAMTVRDAFPFFRGQSKLQRRLKHLKDVGLDYLTLGQPANMLSGGESQRLKLAGHLARGSRARTLFLLDEPTSGLHAADVARLLECFDALLAGGHSLIVIEHNLDVIRAADHLIDLGPGAGPHGGRIIAQGTPAEVSRVQESITGRYLAVIASGEPGASAPG